MFFYSMIVFCKGVTTSLMVKTSIEVPSSFIIDSRHKFAVELIEAIEELVGVKLFEVEGDYVTFEDVDDFIDADFKALECK